MRKFRRCDGEYYIKIKKKINDGGGGGGWVGWPSDS